MVIPIGFPESDLHPRQTRLSPRSERPHPACLALPVPEWPPATMVIQQSGTVSLATARQPAVAYSLECCPRQAQQLAPLTSESDLPSLFSARDSSLRLEIDGESIRARCLL